MQLKVQQDYLRARDLSIQTLTGITVVVPFSTICCHTPVGNTRPSCNCEKGRWILKQFALL